MMKRKKTRMIRVGNVAVGDDNPIVVQSMVKTNPENFQETLNQARELKKAGCEIIRIALPELETCRIITFLRAESGVPIVGDIHFNHKIALKAMEAGVDGIRIDPGAINNVRKVKEIAAVARETATPVRIGINMGSLEKKPIKPRRKANAGIMVESALYYTKLFEDTGWTQLKVSFKGSDLFQTIDAYKKFSKQSDYPLHVGIAESGPLFSGAIKSSVAIGILLNEGIGDTIRVSLTGSPTHEVAAAYHILRGMGLRKTGINIISCPTCGRCKTNLAEIVGEFEREVAGVGIYLHVALMGCEANGPGEAKEADLGIAFGRSKALLFAKGKVVRTGIPREMAKDVLKEAIFNLIAG